MHGSCCGLDIMSDPVTTALVSLPYVIGVLVWAKCMLFLRRHCVNVQAVTHRGSKHRLAFPVVCLVTLVTNIALAEAAQRENAGISLFLLLLSGSLALNLYLAYTVIFHMAWIASAVFAWKVGTSAIAQLEAAFANHQEHKRSLGLCFGVVAGLFAVKVALLATAILVAWLGTP